MCSSDLIVEMLNRILKPEQRTTVLLETMAGKGSEIGRSFEELRAIIDRVELELSSNLTIKQEYYATSNNGAAHPGQTCLLHQ